MDLLYCDAELPLCAGAGGDGDARAAWWTAGPWSPSGRCCPSRIAELEQRIYAMAGEEFNINSPKQLGKILFDKLGLPHGKKTKTGWSTNADVLEKLRDEAPIVGAVLEYRQYAKLKSTYADGLLKAMDPDGRIRTSFQMTVTATGPPELHGAESPEYPHPHGAGQRNSAGCSSRRRAACWWTRTTPRSSCGCWPTSPGTRPCSAAFRSGADIHTVTAAQVFHVAPDAGDPRDAPPGQGSELRHRLRHLRLLPEPGHRRDAWRRPRRIWRPYFATYPGRPERIWTHVVERAREQGYVETLFHRRRELPELKSSNFNLRSFGERVALNMPIQGTAADIMKLAMVAVRRPPADGNGRRPGWCCRSTTS